MPYTTREATNTLFGYLGINKETVQFVPDTNNRAFIFSLPNGEDCIIFIYPISRKVDDTKNFFDTRDSGARERGIAWNHAITRGLKYFCIAVHDQVEKYKDYAFSLECDEERIAQVAGTVEGRRNGSGTQVVIPSDFVPSKSFERIHTRFGFYIAVAHKDHLINYLETYDNRPYMKTENSLEKNDDILKFNLFGIHIMKENDALSDVRPHICIGWSNMGDISALSTKEEIEEKYIETWPSAKPKTRGQDVGQIWRFKNDVKIGDYIIFADGSLCHIGRVESDYYFDSNEYENQSDDYMNVRDVIWLKKNINRSELSTALHKSLSTGMSIWTMNDYRAAVADLINGTYVKDEIEENDIPDQDNQEDTKEIATGGINKIYYGAPGCGKSRHVSDMLSEAGVLEQNIVRTTFHPEYSNVDFIGQILPIINKKDGGEDKVEYKFNPGSLTDALLKAYNTTDMVYLIVEEINRGNAAAIFGDMFQLLDRERDSTKANFSASEYPVSNPNLQKYLIDEVKDETIKNRLKNGVYIPSNLTILATMNSSDQNVFTLDTAFKRRWSFEQISNDITKDTNHSYKGWYVPGTNVTWETFLTKLNIKILDYKIHNQTNEDKRLGKYFVTQNCLTDEVKDISDVQDTAMEFAYKVLEYVWNDVCKIGREEWFDTEKYRTLEDLIAAFISPDDGNTPLSVFQSIDF